MIFALMLAVLMMMMGGIAVDLMRFESRRTSLQNTLDRSTLAATALNQQLDPRHVVDDYFLKAGLAEYLTSVTVVQGLNFRQVTATAAADSEPLFLHMMGIQKFDALGLSQAEQRVNNVEVMLVLDVSGSMGSNNKLVNLKTAAKSFVSTVLNNDPEHKISIGIVPFDGQVNLGPDLVAQFNTQYPSGMAGVNCVDLPASAYNSPSISQYAFAATPTPIALPLTAHADTYSNYGSTAPYDLNRWCPPMPNDANIVRLPNQSVATLQGQIDGLSAIGATSINAGMKWGLGLLDPSSRPIYTSLIAGGKINNALAGRPYEYDDREAMKVIVLMTDGEHFMEDRVKPAYKGGFSPMFKGNSDSRYSIFHSSKVDSSNATNLCNSRPYWVPHLSVWQSRPWNGTSPSGSACYVVNAASGATMQTWPQVWVDMRVQYVAYYMYANPLSNGSSSLRTTLYNQTLSDMREQTATTDMDSQLQAACTQARDNNVVVYGIAFEAPTNGQTQIRNCSTDGENGSHYFNAQGLQISVAFAAIANNISQLRLTQ